MPRWQFRAGIAEVQTAALVAMVSVSVGICSKGPIGESILAKNGLKIAMGKSATAPWGRKPWTSRTRHTSAALQCTSRAESGLKTRESFTSLFPISCPTRTSSKTGRVVETGSAGSSNACGLRSMGNIPEYATRAQLLKEFALANEPSEQVGSGRLSLHAAAVCVLARYCGSTTGKSICACLTSRLMC